MGSFVPDCIRSDAPSPLQKARRPIFASSRIRSSEKFQVRLCTPARRVRFQEMAPLDRRRICSGCVPDCLVVPTGFPSLGFCPASTYEGLQVARRSTKHECNSMSKLLNTSWVAVSGWDLSQMNNAQPLACRSSERRNARNSWPMERMANGWRATAGKSRAEARGC